MIVKTSAEPFWPLFDLRLTCKNTHLRPVRESDLSELAQILPDDFEHNPNSNFWPGQDLASNRRRLMFQGYWRNLGAWSVESWELTFCVIYEGLIVGMQSLEAEEFTVLRPWTQVHGSHPASEVSE